jgi:hypothetical protein
MILINLLLQRYITRIWQYYIIIEKSYMIPTRAGGKEFRIQNAECRNAEMQECRNAGIHNRTGNCNPIA